MRSAAPHEALLGVSLRIRGRRASCGSLERTTSRDDNNYSRGSIPNWYVTTIWLGPIPIQAWGLFVAVGFATAIWLAMRRAPRLGFDPKDVVDFSVWAIVASIVGARLGHVLFYEPTYYSVHPGEILRIWEGGLSSYGGFLGAFLAGIWFVRRRRLPFLRFSDLILSAFPLGWSIGRLGCYSIHDHPGIPCNGFLCVPFPDGTRRLDMGLLDGVLTLGIFLALLVFRKRLAGEGRVTALVIGLYGLGRFLLDFLRVDDATYLGLTPAQYGSAALVILGVWLWSKLFRTSHA